MTFERDAVLGESEFKPFALAFPVSCSGHLPRRTIMAKPTKPKPPKGGKGSKSKGY
jgi:hypothetical protein